MDLPLLETLGFNPSYNKQAITVGDKMQFQISHRGWNGIRAPMVNCCAPNQELEQPIAGNDSRRRSKSPHDELQATLMWRKIANGA